jgi:hypothetical protein
MGTPPWPEHIPPAKQGVHGEVHVSPEAGSPTMEVAAVTMAGGLFRKPH